MKHIHHLALLMLLMISPALHAQQNPNGVLQLNKVAQPFLLLVRDPAVHRDLRLTPDQIHSVMELNDRLDAGMWARRNKSAEAIHETNRELTTKTMQALATILDAKQLARIGQIQLWLLGSKSLAKEDVAEQVGLEPSQTAGVQAIIAGTDKEVAQLYKQLEEGGDRDELNKQYRQVQLEQQERILALLNEDQKLRWRSLLGPAIDVTELGRIKFKAPEFQSGSGWVNSQPLQLSELEGTVVAVHFYALSCINCQRNYPWYKDWHDNFASQGLTVVGIHTPEFSSEEGTGTVAADAKAAGLRFPILVDDQKNNWNAWGNSMWPSVYLVDKQGYVRYWWYGELNWQGANGQKIFKQRIQELLAEKD